MPSQTRVSGNDGVYDNSDTSGRHLNTKSSACVRCSKVELNPLAHFHHGEERQMAHTSDKCDNNIEQLSMQSNLLGTLKLFGREDVRKGAFSYDISD